MSKMLLFGRIIRYYTFKTSLGWVMEGSLDFATSWDEGRKEVHTVQDVLFAKNKTFLLLLSEYIGVFIFFSFKIAKDGTYEIRESK